METAHVTRARTSGEPILGRYELFERLGSGGFGTVYAARDLKLDRDVAVKRIPVSDDAVAERARREGKAAARLGHPGIVALYETANDDDAVYLVSELVDGRTLAELVAAGELSDRDVLRIGMTLCDALAHAHGRGVVHRDVKPGNIIVPDDPREAGAPAKLTDFGIARIVGDDALTRTGDVVGTLAYMAPEQAEGRETGPAADLYALGLCLYEALAGVNPVRGKGAAATARRVGQRLPPLGRLRRDLPLALCEAIDATVWAHPEDRGTVKELRRALAAAVPGAGDEPGTIAGPPVVDPIAVVGPHAPTPWRARALAAAAAATLAGLAGATAGSDPALQVAVATLVAVALLPRLGWLLAAAAVCVVVAQEEPDLAVLLAFACAPVPVLLRFAPPAAWSLPGLAPGLALLGAAGAYPALAGQLRHWMDRAALGGIGLWWILLGESLSDRRLLLGPPEPGSGAQAAWVALTSGAIALAALWALAAAALPLLVRGRHLAADIVGATAWSATVAATTAQIALALAWQPQPRGLVLGAVVGGAMAVGARASRRTV